MKAPLLDRLAAKYEVDHETGCWLWTASLGTAGYGQVGVQIDGRCIPKGAHRAAYEELVGPVPDGMEMDHLCHANDGSCVGGVKCRHRRCINPDHLEPVTRSENTRRGLAARLIGAANAAKTHCPQGHPYDEANTCAASRGDGTASRRCRTCARDTNRRYRARVAA